MKIRRPEFEASQEAKGLRRNLGSLNMLFSGYSHLICSLANNLYPKM